MLHEIVNLKEIYNLEGDPKLEVMIPSTSDSEFRKKSRGILICPGGAYVFVSHREGDAVAIEYMREDYCTFVLTYSTNKAFPIPMHELACAIDYIRNNAEKYYLNKDEIAIVGFSAGGHLVSSYGYLYKHPLFIEKTRMNPENIKPNAIISSYPVISMGEYTHFESRDKITGKNVELYDLLSVEKNIDETYPPTFLWTTKEDTCVPYENTILFDKALKSNNVKHKTIIFKHLDHGKSTGSKIVNDIDKKNKKHYKKLSSWVSKSIKFMDEIF